MRLSAEGLKTRANGKRRDTPSKFDREKVDRSDKEIRSGSISVREIFSVHFRQMWYRTC